MTFLFYSILLIHIYLLTKLRTRRKKEQEAELQTSRQVQKSKVAGDGRPWGYAGIGSVSCCGALLLARSVFYSDFCKVAGNKKSLIFKIMKIYVMKNQLKFKDKFSIL